jgi:excisionase family DNA binding protein
MTTEHQILMAVGGGRKLSHRREQMRFYTMAEVGEILGVSVRTVRRWIDRKKLVAHYFGKAVRVADADLRAFIVQHRRV